MSKRQRRVGSPLNLTPIEIDVLRELASGLKPIEVAGLHRCSSTAVSMWMKKARQASGAKTTFQLIAMAVKQGIITA